jgi:hypothetical protein
MVGHWEEGKVFKVLLLCVFVSCCLAILIHVRQTVSAVRLRQLNCMALASACAAKQSPALYLALLSALHCRVGPGKEWTVRYGSSRSQATAAEGISKHSQLRGSMQIIMAAFALCAFKLCCCTCTALCTACHATHSKGATL